MFRQALGSAPLWNEAMHNMAAPTMFSPWNQAESGTMRRMETST